MNTRRPGRDEELNGLDARDAEAVVVAAGTLRAPDPRPDPTHRHPDDRLSVFWRVFGGTILSITALVAITLYNNLSNTINELRTEVSRANEARAELVKKEEFNARTQNIWDRVQTLQELRATVAGLKEQVSGFSEKQGDLKSVRDQLGLLEQRLKMAEDDHKALAKAENTITALEQKAAARDAQFKAAEEERKELAKQLLELRERLAKVEGVTEVKPMPKSATAKGD